MSRTTASPEGQTVQVAEHHIVNDRDGNGVELYRDRPREEWPHSEDGELAMVTLPLDLDALLAEAPASTASS